MHLYRDPLWHAWRAVDVLVDGQLQRGHVINVAEGGLIIDFGCAGQRSQLVEYGRIFHSSSTHSFYATLDEQALLRRPSDGAWIWHPGRVVPLGGCRHEECQCVDVQLPDGTIRELVRCSQVRSPPSDAELQGWRVGKGDFVIRECALPVQFWRKGSQGLGEIFSCQLGRDCAVLCTSLLSQTLVYLQHHTGNPLRPKQVGLVYNKARSEMDKRFFAKTPIVSKNRKRKIAGSRHRNLALPVELLIEVFQSLDSIDRVRCRRVSPLWNDILTTDAYFPDVRISGTRDYGEVPLPDASKYWITACLLKCLSNATKTLVLMQLGAEACAEVSLLIQHILNGHRIPTTVFYDCDFSCQYDLLERVLQGAAGLLWKCSCHRIVWKKCRMSDYSLSAAVALHTFSVRSEEEMEEQLWDVFEGNLQLTRPLDRVAVEEWILDVLGDGHQHHLNDIILTGLNEYQSADPRPTTQYRDREWTEMDISEVDETLLTALTMAYLQKMMDEEAF
ncbi:uncharacterized protein LOC129592469 [Paramacrobiotus metropolitanus]|uniref:uncharacterized protein LOC129592469 n=1 Tax=Paramacrobiotus metropolitanus TaxID=2943436 RepID=UPI002445D5C0|nr:uncharacterized protein LOC129592469 [Paramacrobiotus metropolitanus]